MTTRSISVTAAVLLLLALASVGSGPTRVHAANPASPTAMHWSITLKASATSLRIGSVVTLGVRAPAAAFRGKHRVYLEDLSTRQIMRVCTLSAGLNGHRCIAQDQQEVPATRQYQAFIVHVRKTGLSVLARSPIVRVVWRAAGTWSVSLTADGKTSDTVAQGSTVTLRAVSSRPLGGEYSLEIRARGCIPNTTTCIRGGILIATCYSGTVCIATVTAPAEGGTTERYRATVRGPTSGGSGTVARSRWVTVQW